MTIDKDLLKKNWFRKRKIMTILGIIQKCVYYFEYSAISVSVLYYYNNIIKVDNPKLFVGLALGAIFVSGTISTYICGRFMDKTRNLRGFGLLGLFCGMVGNLTYSLPFSPWCPIIGRLLCGLQAPIQSTFSG